MKELMKEIKKAQIAFHITGVGDIELVYEHSYETMSGKKIIYKAVRNSEKGLSYDIYKEEISIGRGHKVTYMGHTHPWGRQEVKIC